MITIDLSTTRKKDLWIISLDKLSAEDLVGRKTIARRLKIANLPHSTKARIWPQFCDKANLLLALDKAKEGYLLPWAFTL